MKLLTLLALTIAPCGAAFAQLTSPDGQYVIEYVDARPHESNVRLKHAKTGKILKHAFSNGAGESAYLETAWSPDSRYLAVVERGTRTTAELAVFAFAVDSVEELRLPDYRLNLLGRRLRVEGGRSHWVSRLRWNGSVLTFDCKGQWADGPADPEINPDNWYHFEVALALGEAGRSANPRLVSVAVIERGR